VLQRAAITSFLRNYLNIDSFIESNEYLLWAISDGGKQFETEMPSFKNKLSREEIWRVIACMRSGFPPPPAR